MCVPKLYKLTYFSDFYILFSAIKIIAINFLPFNNVALKASTFFSVG